MKRSERQKLKTNEFAMSVARAREILERRWREVSLAVVALVVAATGIGAYVIWRERTTNQANAMLAEALAIAEAPVVPPAPASPALEKSSGASTPAAATQPSPGSYPTQEAKLQAIIPRFLAIATAYPNTLAGVAARYHAAAAHAALGRTREAADLYRDVIARDPASVYGQMSRLGLAEVEFRARNFEAAIRAYTELLNESASALPMDAILVQLGRVYGQAGKTKEARDTFQRVLDQYPDSPYAAAARQELDNLPASTS